MQKIMQANKKEKKNRNPKGTSTESEVYRIESKKPKYQEIVMLFQGRIKTQTQNKNFRLYHSIMWILLQKWKVIDSRVV